MNWLGRLKLLSLRAIAPRALVLLALAAAVAWGGECGSLLQCFSPKTLAQLTPEEMEGAYVEDNIDFLHTLYAREEEYRHGEPTGKVLGARYVISFDEDRYMALCIHSGDLSRAERMMDACRVYLYGELAKERLPVLPVSGSVRALTGEELDCYLALGGAEDTLLPYCIDVGRVGGRPVAEQVLLALTALALAVLGLWPAVWALAGGYQRQVRETLAQAWSRSIALERAGQFYERTEPTGGVRLGPEFVFFQQGAKSVLLRPWDVAWAYGGTIRRRLTGRTVPAVFLRTMNGRTFALPMGEADSAALLEAMAAALPGAVLGYSQETEERYRNDRAFFSARWDEVRRASRPE